MFSLNNKVILIILFLSQNNLEAFPLRKFVKLKIIQRMDPQTMTIFIEFVPLQCGQCVQHEVLFLFFPLGWKEQLIVEL